MKKQCIYCAYDEHCTFQKTGNTMIIVAPHDCEHFDPTQEYMKAVNEEKRKKIKLLLEIL